MNAANRLPDCIQQIIQGSTDAVTFVEGMETDDFLNDLRTQRAVVMCLMIIGEAASRIVTEYPDFARDNASVPWRSIRGMRNRITHGYFDIDLNVVWQTVNAELPPLIKRLTGC